MKGLNLLLLWASLFGLFHFGLARIEISESANQFRFPNFSPNGYIEWVLEGQSGLLVDQELNIEALLVRIYASDRDNRQLGTVRSDSCQYDTESSFARSKASIQIEGSGFNLSGRDWAYDLKTKTIDIAHDSGVHFSESVDRMFSEFASEGESLGTQIKSDSLHLVIEPNSYRFRFMGGVQLTSGSIVLHSDLLEIDLLNASSQIEFSIPSGELSGIHRVEASGLVQFNSPEYDVSSSRVHLNPKQNHAFFDGAAVIQMPQAQLRGDRIELDRRKIFLQCFENRLASFSLNGAVLDSFDGMDPLFSDREFYIQSEQIYFERANNRYTYHFENRVFFQSQSYRIYSDRLKAETNSMPNVDEKSIFQELLFAHADGSVRLKAEAFNIQSQSLNYLPKENCLKASESVYYESEFAELSADELVVKNDMVHASSRQDLVSVSLPKALDFGFNLNNVPNQPKYNEDEGIQIQSEIFYLDRDGSLIHSHFKHAVRAQQYSAKLIAEELELVWREDIHRKVEPNRERFVIQTAFASGSVDMTQGDFFASADQLSIFPEEERILLYGEGGKAQLKDSQGTVFGERIDYNRRLKQSVVSGKGGASRARIQFELPDRILEDSLEE
ncbi:MAG: hypothetical protein CMI19_01580 [Opitutae bacterium]|nr:hypothetical protein [Opitutae bacterium]|tara:strand:- start:6339 stop:8183 length:1845 start_codon:yes stop_codon:yes gene_type:complete